MPTPENPARESLGENLRRRIYNFRYSIEHRGNPNVDPIGWAFICALFDIQPAGTNAPPLQDEVPIWGDLTYLEQLYKKSQADNENSVSLGQLIQAVYAKHGLLHFLPQFKVAVDALFIKTHTGNWPSDNTGADEPPTEGNKL